ncbi:hypothetical protein CLU85_1205 [Acidovorax sp. 69]|nr:hypothetical protein BSY15_3260 [Acidovorax sp. RAC01]PJI96459.1 hypothetical protein CLU85_1205 [Acidovorax sp. 69]
MRSGMTRAEVVGLSSWTRGPRSAITAVTLGAALALAGCSGSKTERMMVKGCTDGGSSKKTCQCAVDKMGERYDLKNLDEFAESRGGIPLQTLQADFVKALVECVQKHGR